MNTGELLTIIGMSSGALLGAAGVLWRVSTWYAQTSERSAEQSKTLQQIASDLQANTRATREGDEAIKRELVEHRAETRAAREAMERDIKDHEHRIRALERGIE